MVRACNGGRVFKVIIYGGVNMFTENLKSTDPEFAEFFQNFAYDEVVNQNDLEAKTRYMAILATLLGCQAKELFTDILEEALNAGVTPVEIKEIAYQATAYLGIGRTYGFLRSINEVFAAKGIVLPVEGQATTMKEDRVEKGNEAQITIFGENMRGYQNAGPEETRHINRWLAGNCFGDYYTRGGLDLAKREMITFCFILAQGGCEPQLMSHIAGNLNMGNDKEFLIKVLSQCMPYIGYPRTLNALRCINEAAK